MHIFLLHIIVAVGGCTYSGRERFPEIFISWPSLPHRSSKAKGNELSEGANSCSLFFSENLLLSQDKLAFHSSRE